MAAEAVRVRPASPGDLNAIAAIERQVAINPWSLSQFVSSSLKDSVSCLVLDCRGSKLCGFAIYQRLDDEATLLNIAVRADCQGSGYGRLLLRAVLDSLLGAAVRRVLLEVRCSNAAAISLYRRHGFVDDGLRRDYYPTATGREDALLMSCKLGECR